MNPTSDDFPSKMEERFKDVLQAISSLRDEMKADSTSFREEIKSEITSVQTKLDGISLAIELILPSFWQDRAFEWSPLFRPA
jgi:hypothetical protein